MDVNLEPKYNLSRSPKHAEQAEMPPPDTAAAGMLISAPPPVFRPVPVYPTSPVVLDFAPKPLLRRRRKPRVRTIQRNHAAIRLSRHLASRAMRDASAFQPPPPDFEQLHQAWNQLNVTRQQKIQYHHHQQQKNLVLAQLRERAKLNHKKYNSYSDDVQRDTVLSMLKLGERVIDTHRRTGIPYQTILYRKYHFLKESRLKHKPKQVKHEQWDSWHKTWVAWKNGMDNEITYEQLKRDFCARFPNAKVPSLTTIRRWIKGAQITPKMLIRIPAGRNTEEAKEQRVNYVMWSQGDEKDPGLNPMFAIYIDEGTGWVKRGGGGGRNRDLDE